MVTVNIMPEGRSTREGLFRFAEALRGISQQVGFKMSSRGWAYQLEGFGFISKAQFGRVENLINTCRTRGLLPIDFVAEEGARQFSGVEIADDDSPERFMMHYLQGALTCEEWYTPDWWAEEDYYIQMVVEKIDLKTLFAPVCEEYHIPIATSRGWSSMLQRAEYARRFLEAEDRGLQPVLLYCGDFDPDGGRISDFLRKNLADLQDVTWIDGTPGFDPTSLIIDRFGLNVDFIEAQGLTWIDNLITGSGRDLASSAHPNHFLPYVQEYLGLYGPRKCEANALVVRSQQAEQLCRDAIENYIGAEALDRFEARREEIREQLVEFRERTGLNASVGAAIERIERDS